MGRRRCERRDRTGTPVLAVEDAAASPFGLGGESLNDLDGGCDRQEVDETNVLVCVAKGGISWLRGLREKRRRTSNDLDLVDRPEARKVVSERLLGDGLVEVAKVDVPRRTRLLNGHEDAGSDGARASPAELEVLIVQTNLAHERVGMERSGGRRVEEADEGAALLGEDLDRVDGAEANLAEELVDGGVRGKVADVDGASLQSESEVSFRRPKDAEERNARSESSRRA